MRGEMAHVGVTLDVQTLVLTLEVKTRDTPIPGTGIGPDNVLKTSTHPCKSMVLLQTNSP